MARPKRPRRAHVHRMQCLLPHLEALYERYNRAEYISPDPLQFLAGYPDPRDREIAGLIASSLAFGNVKQIVASIDSVLMRMPRPAKWLRDTPQKRIDATFASFRHRYVSGTELSQMLWGAKCAIESHGSLGELFAYHSDETETNVLPALGRFSDVLRNGAPVAANYLLPSPALGSACKRWHMYLRWMVRRDNVDPGGWERVSASQLIVPLDTHMHRIGMALGLTTRKQADLRTALEITEAFRVIAPDDPIRYDFALTRLGIRREGDLKPFLEDCRNARKQIYEIAQS
jgi:uncharacterized protein (TIGR02757 family)